MSDALLVALFGGAVAGGTPILYAGLGETISQRAGVINVGTDGTMLVGALTAFAVTVHSGNAVVGTVCGAGAGAALASLFAWMVVYRRASQLAAGLGILFLALGLTALFGYDYVSSDISGYSPVGIPGLKDISVIGPSFFNRDPLVYASYFAVPFVFFLLFRTRWGLLVRSAGESPDALRAYGISPTRVRAMAVVVAGAFAGIGGAQLSTALALSWSENMTAGRGFIAVALVMFAAWSPIRVLGGAYLFGLAISLGSVLQVLGVQINQFLLDAIPYLLTLSVLVAFSRLQSQAAPEALGVPA